MKKTYRARDDEPAGVYLLVQSQNPEWVKVGAAKSMDDRLTSLRTSHPLPTLLSYAAFLALPDAYYKEAERLAHRALKEAGLHRGNGEWFKGTPEQILSIIDPVIQAGLQQYI